MPRATAAANADPTPDANPCAQALAQWLGSLPAEACAAHTHAPWAVAYSGGADSTALLHAALDTHTGPVIALHVNHGLQAAAANFEQHARTTCRAWQVPLHVAQAHIHLQPGQSLEAEARRARYAALTNLAQAHGVQHVLLGHHADDQVESVLIAWLRGAGLRGLSGMPTTHTRSNPHPKTDGLPGVPLGAPLGVQFHRPLLVASPPVSASALRGWLTRQALPFIEDPSNADERFTRNALRHRLTPILDALAPAHRQTVLRSAQHLAQAQRLLDELAAQDRLATGTPPRIDKLRSLSADRLDNLLRHWLYTEHGCTPSTAQLQALCELIAACRTRGHGISLRVGAGRVVRDGPAIRYLP